MASAFQYTLFYYSPYLYDYSYYLNYQDAIATRKITGVNLMAYYPLNRYYRTEATIGFYNFEEDFLYPMPGSSGQFWNGNLLSASFSIVGETTRFKSPYGPAAGKTFMLSLTQAIPVARSFLQNTTVEADFRQYLNIGADALFAFRFNGFASRGKNPFVFYWGGNNQVRSADYYSIIGNEGWYANLEFRFPLINAAATVIGQIGPIRGTFFFDIARAKIKGYEAKFITFGGFDDSWEPIFREAEAIGSFGYGFQFFFLGLPLHLEFVKRLEFPDISDPFNYHQIGKFETKFWIGFDF